VKACTVKIGSFDWDSAKIHTSIASYILENGYNCNIDYENKNIVL
tara:strand:+ start:214 stop:348 length:135 start_codon:yes stop_codon:yes gene_type:complete